MFVSKIFVLLHQKSHEIETLEFVSLASLVPSVFMQYDRDFITVNWLNDD
jgi:hypothetical protein